MRDAAPDAVVSLAVVYRSPDAAARARDLSSSLGVRCVGPGEDCGAEVAIEIDDGVIAIRDRRGRGLRPLRVDFEPRASPSKKQPLGRAVGRTTRTVLDATAGWGVDTRRLCAMGYSVTAVERHPVMAVLLEDAAGRAARVGISKVPRIVAADAIDYLAGRPGQWDCIYLDPMFPPKRRVSTLAKRPMRLLRDLAGDDPDRRQLFDAACASAARRVVVKRPDHSAPVFGDPGEIVAGKLVCYDVYHVH